MLNAKENLSQGIPDLGARSDGNVVDLIAQLDSLRKHGILSEAEFQRKKADLLAKL
jgi:Short C-terminal domain